jgi:hypothetical protein
MTFAADEKTKESVKQFRSFDVDTQLALLWFGYLDIKDQLTPTNANSSQTAAASVFHQIEALSKEEQLQAQRDIVAGVDTPISRAYGAMDPSAKIDIWLRLAQAMERGDAIQVPSDYKLPERTKQFADSISSLDFEQRLDFMRSVSFEMGVK